MAITVRRVDDDLWEAVDGASPPAALRTLLRPDGRRYLVLDRSRDDTGGAGVIEALLRTIRADVAGELVHRVDEHGTPEAEVFRAEGFHPARTELTVEITLDGQRLGRLRRATVGAGLDLIGAADADLARLRALDEAIRVDIPGSEGWIWTPEAFAWETFGPDFDPATYRIAVDPSSGAYVGLLRVWMKPDGPVVGCLGVRRDRRGSRVTAMLVADVSATLLQRGHRTVRADVDALNRASLGVVGRFDHRVVRRTVELVHHGS